jgi:hypothetical protein
MTRLWTDGAEMGDILFFSGGHVSASTTQYASGAYSYVVASLGTPTPWKNLDVPLSELYFRERMYQTSHYAAILVEFRSGATVCGYVTTDSLGHWICVVDGVTLGTSTTVRLISHWYCLEVHFVIDDTNGVFDVLVDGNSVITFHGDTTFIGGSADIDNLTWVCALPGSSLYIDDLALNDTAGGVDDSWCGGGRVIKMKPIGDGTPVNQWDGSDGNKIANWELVDEIPKDDDVTYIYADAAASGIRDQYIVEDYDGTDRAVERIWAEVRARKTIAAPAGLNIGFDTGASINVDDVGILNEQYDLRHVGPEYLVNPDDGLAWEEADLDLLQLVVESG